MCIDDIPYETTTEELKENIIISDSDASFSITDIEGEIKTGRIEDGDRVVVEADGEEYEYYLKTGINGVSYSDSFNYRSYEEYKEMYKMNKLGYNVYLAVYDSEGKLTNVVKKDNVSMFDGDKTSTVRSNLTMAGVNSEGKTYRAFLWGSDLDSSNDTSMTPYVK